MLNHFELNFVAVLVATVVGFCFGFLWYSRFMFGHAWLAAIGKSKEELGNPAKALVLSFVATAVTAVVLSLFISWIGVVDMTEGLLVGLYTGVGFVATSLFSDYLFCGWSMKLFLIQAGYRVSTLALMGAVLGVWE
jgi:hypothetical protein